MIDSRSDETNRARRPRRWLLAAAVVATIGGSVVAVAPASADTQTFTADGSFVVPAGVTSINVVALGAWGGTCVTSAGGFGGQVVANLVVTPGETLSIRVGGLPTDSAGGSNGGGDPGPGVSTGGGGATDVRQGGAALANRVVVAGGGGGCGLTSNGGYADHPVGADGAGVDAGKGGTQTAGGLGGIGGNAGVLGVGGNTAATDAGGGGGGYYGGGGAGANIAGGGGGGGSSYAGPGTSSVTYSSFSEAAAGRVELTWTPAATTTTAAPGSTTTTPGATTTPNPASGAGSSGAPLSITG